MNVEDAVMQTLKDIAGRISPEARAKVAKHTRYALERARHARANAHADDLPEIIRTEAQNVKARLVGDVVELADSADDRQWLALEGMIGLAARLLPAAV